MTRSAPDSRLQPRRVSSASHLPRDRPAHALRTYRQDGPPAVQSHFHRTLTRLTGKIFRTLGQLTPDGLDAMPLALLAPLAFDALAAACQGPQLPLPAGVPSAIAPNATYRITAARPKPADFGASAAPIIPMTPGMFTQSLALADPAEQFLLTARGLLPEQMAIPDLVLAESVRRYAVDIYTFPFRDHALTLPPHSFPRPAFCLNFVRACTLESGHCPWQRHPPLGRSVRHDGLALSGDHERDTTRRMSNRCGHGAFDSGEGH